MQSLPSTLPLQTLPANPGNLTPLSMDASLLNPGNSGSIMSSMAQNFCIQNGTLGNNGASSGITVPPHNSISSGVPSHLSTLPIASMFSLNPGGMAPQFVQPLGLPQQSALALSLNQQPPQQAQQMGQPAPGISIGSTQSVPLGQVVCSSVAATPINFVSPTLFAMSGPSGNQNQYLPTQFTQFPIMLNSQQSIFTSMNPAMNIPSQTLEAAPLSQPSLISSLPSISPSLHQSVDSSLVSLNSQPVSVFSFPSPAMSVAPLTKLCGSENLQSPDTTNATLVNSSDIKDSGLTVKPPETSVENSNSNAVSSSTPTTFVPISLPSPVVPSPVPQSDEMTCIKPEPDVNGVKGEEAFVTNIPAAPVAVTPCARMKFTPVDSVAPGPALSDKESDAEDSDENSNEGNGGVEDNPHNLLSGLMEVDDRDSSTGHFHPVVVKSELYEPLDGEYPDDDRSKHSSSPIESLKLMRTSGHYKDLGAGHAADGQGDLADVEDLEEAEFVWEDYLRETGATAVPPTAFKHVENSLQSGFSKGMKLEAPNKLSPNTYWVASVVMTCGPLLRLRYEGYHDNSSADFWSDPMTSDIHPVGWCEENGKTLQPPSMIKEKYPNWQEFLTTCLHGAASAPVYLLDKSTGATPVDQIKEGTRLEIQEDLRPDCLWLVKIVENVGGRLYLRYEGVDSVTQDFWLFYLHERLHPIGWGENAGYRYAVPQVVRSATGKSDEDLMKILQTALAQAVDQNLPADIFNDQQTIEPHRFEVGMKLETLDIKNGNSICPATVVKVIDSKYFLIEVDNLVEKETGNLTRYCCHRKSPTIFPAHWASSRRIKVSAPQGWGQSEFRWSDYLRHCDAAAAPDGLFDLVVPEHEFECGMKLEAVKPGQPHQICAATVTNIVEHLVWVHLDSSKRTMDAHVESVRSLNLFPIGWCVSNGYQLKPPGRPAGSAPRRVAVVQPEIADGPRPEKVFHAYNDRELYGGPQIYFNHLCFSGPYLSKGRIAGLPRSVGPGSVSLVMKEVLGMLINTAYKSCRVLRELQLEGCPNPNMTQHMLKAKYKGKCYRAVVEICRTAGELEEFCRHVCMKLECCPNLISPRLITGSCPENCAQLTKTKYTYYYGKRKKKIGRPPGGHSNLENGQKKPGKRRKRKKIGMIAKRSTRPTVEDQGDHAEDDKASVCSDSRTVDSTSTSGSKERGESRLSRELALKRRYTHHIPPPSEIRTRGAKLPKYSFEKRTHKKIMIVEASQQNAKSRKERSRNFSSLSETPVGMSESSFSTTRPEVPVSLKSEPPLKLEKNPLEWTVSEVGEFLLTTDCADRELIARLKTEEIDGQALLLLTLPSVQEYMGVKLGPAIKLCHLIQRVKVAFYQNFAR